MKVFLKMHKFLLWVSGFIFAELLKYLLKDINIPEFVKWLIGVVIIVGIFIIVDKVSGVINKK